jgi:hypothetical protein
MRKKIMKTNLHNPRKSKLEELDEQERVQFDDVSSHELKRLKELDEKLPKPWVASEVANGGRYYVAELSRPGARGIWDDSGTASRDVCELIAMMRNRLPYLLELAEKDLAKAAG